MKIVSAYQGMAAYVTATRQNPDADRTHLWATLAVEPYWADWAAGQPMEERVRQGYAKPVDDLDTLGERTALLAASGVEGRVAETLERLAGLLPKTEETVVCIYALNPRNRVVSERQHGVLGQCIGDNILLCIDPTVPEWLDWVPQVLAHEYHHSVWGYNWYAVKGNGPADLLTSMLCDGQAEAFGYLVAPSVQPLWPQFSADQEAELWAGVQQHLGAADLNTYVRYMFGDAEAGIPWCFGYQVGYHIVKAYLGAHPDRTVVDLLDMDAREILRESGYPGPRAGASA